jgi:hypothetical protein
MLNKDKLICATYALIAIAALPATWINNLAFIQQPNNTFTDFFVAAYTNAAAASLANDLFLLALAASMFMVIEGKRVGVSRRGGFSKQPSILPSTSTKTHPPH